MDARINSNRYVLQRRFKIESTGGFAPWTDYIDETSYRRIVATRKFAEANPYFGVAIGTEFRILVLQLKEIL